MTLPDSSDMNIFSTYVPICRLFPLPVVPRSSTPAISLAKLQKKKEKKHQEQMITFIPDGHRLFAMNSPDTARALDTARHDGFDERADVFVLHRSLPF